MRIQSIERAIGILNLFKANRSSLSLAEIASGMGIAKTTIHTILKTLEYNGFLRQDIYTKKYSLGFALFELGALQATNMRINRNSSKPLHVLANESNSCCRLAIWDADTVFITLTVFPQGLDNQSRQLGPRIPAYCTGLGKAILAHLPDERIALYLDKTELSPYTKYTITDRNDLMKDLKDTKLRGYSISNRETLLHQIGVAAPIFDEAGNIIAAASIELNPEETDEERIEKSATRLLRATHEISTEMGYQPLSILPDIG